jgi:hypothetical protein
MVRVSGAVPCAGTASAQLFLFTATGGPGQSLVPNRLCSPKAAHRQDQALQDHTHKIQQYLGFQFDR